MLLWLKLFKITVKFLAQIKVKNPKIKDINI